MLPLYNKIPSSYAAPTDISIHSSFKIAKLCIFTILVILLTYWVRHDYTIANNYTHFTPYQYHHLAEVPGLIPLNESQSRLKFSPRSVILDGHAHTVASDGKLTMPQLLEHSRAQGFTAVVVSDHQSAEPGLAAQTYARERYPKGRGMVVIPGQEYTCCRIHMNFYNINQTVQVPRAFPSDEELQAAIDQVHQMGGLVIVNHLPWSLSPEGGQGGLPRLQGHPTREQLKDWGVDGFEVVGENVFDYPTYRFCRDHGLIAVTGTDTHHPTEGTYGWTVVDLDDDMNGHPITAEAVIRALRTPGRVQLVYKPEGLIPVPEWSGIDLPRTGWLTQWLSPVLEMGGIFDHAVHVNKGMYSFVDGEFCHSTKVVVKPFILISALVWVVLLCGLWKAFNILMSWILSHFVSTCLHQPEYMKTL